MFKISQLVIVAVLAACGIAEHFEECENVPTGSYVAVENNCRAFIYCHDEENSFMDNCPEETYFNEELSECVIDVDNICPVNEELYEEEEQESEKDDLITIDTETTTAAAIVTTIIEQVVESTTRPKCTRLVNAYYPHSQRCEYYFKCTSGFLTISRCSFNYAWDYQKEMCVPHNTVKCYGKSKLASSIIKNFSSKLHL